MSHPQRFPVSVHICLLDRDSVLLLRRARTGFLDGYHTVPAGHVEDGESVIDAAVREVLEEIGVEVREQDLEVFGVGHRNAQPTRIDFFLRCESWRGTPRLAEPAKADSVSWFHLDALPNKVVPHVRSALARHQEDLWYRETGWPVRVDLRPGGN